MNGLIHHRDTENTERKPSTADERGWTQIRGTSFDLRAFVSIRGFHIVFICVSLRPSAVKVSPTSVNSVSLW